MLLGARQILVRPVVNMPEEDLRVEARVVAQEAEVAAAADVDVVAAAEVLNNLSAAAVEVAADVAVAAATAVVVEVAAAAEEEEDMVVAAEALAFVELIDRIALTLVEEDILAAALHS